MSVQIWLVSILMTLTPLYITSQEAGKLNSANQGQFSGNLEATGSFFLRDSLIGAFNTPQYDRQLYGADAWLNLNYTRQGYDFGLRFDLFQNSNLLIPKGSYTDQGIGRWYIKKKINKLGIQGGYIYDIIGSGIIFRAYEERAQAIDQALYGLQLAYDLNPDWKVKVFTGRQKQQFDTYKSVVRGLSVDGHLSSDTSNVTFSPGFGIVGRTLDDASMNNLVATLNTYLMEDVFIPKYNTYALSFYNTLTSGPISWYVEGAWKSNDSFNDPFENRITVSGDTISGRFTQKTGNVVYSSLSYANHGLGITLEGKRTENFDFRTRPQEEGNQGLLHYIPPMARINTYRVLARYAPATQYLGELAFQADLKYAFSKNLNLTLNFSNIENLEGLLLYRDFYVEMYYKHLRKWTINGGIQHQQYNQDIYQGKPGAPMVKSITPFADFLYKINRTTALRFEAQYMSIRKEKGDRPDYGNWLFGLAEFTLAPHWSVTVSDMVNISPGKLSPVNSKTGKSETIHFSRLDLAYRNKSNRFSLGYIKQPEGIVCSGGICRLEPAFNGIRMGINSTF